jgi:hypothetical protein
VTHYSEDDLTLYYYGEGRRRHDIERHLETCAGCASTYREIAGTLAMIAAPEVPARGDQYGLEIWQRIRFQLPERETGFSRFWGFSGLGFSMPVLAAAALLLIAAFVGGRAWQRSLAPVATTAVNGGGSATPENRTNRILLTTVADHLDRSERVLTDIMNAPRGDISTEQRWADDLLDASRLYRQDALDAGERSVAAILDDLERSLIEIVNSPSKISAADLEQIRRRIDAASLLFKVRAMSDELHRREDTPERSTPRPSTSTRVTS